MPFSIAKSNVGLLLCIVALFYLEYLYYIQASGGFRISENGGGWGWGGGVGGGGIQY